MSRLEKLNNRLLYNARFTVHRSVSFQRENGITGQKWTKVSSLTDLPCNISYSNRNALGNRGRMDSPDENLEEANSVHILASLFCSHLHPLYAGDRIVVVKEGKSAVYWAGEPFVYPYYQHLLLLDSREA